MSSQLIELSDALAQATDRAAVNTVAVHTEARGSSSGVIWRSGVIVTSEHALRRDDEIHVTLADGRVVPATLAGSRSFDRSRGAEMRGSGDARNRIW